MCLTYKNGQAGFKCVTIGREKGRRSMNIRLLQENEIQRAVNVAHETYRTCLLPLVRMEEEVRQYNNYVNYQNLWSQVQGGTLFLWGLFEKEELCAVSAMRNNGHITMLYVRPAFQRKGYGTTLLSWMRGWAKKYLRLKKVTVNVTPAVQAGYFAHVGFRQIPVAVQQASFLPMEAKTGEMPQIRPDRTIRWNAILGVSIGTLVLVVGIAIVYCIIST